jgi:hypothetical protein
MKNNPDPAYGTYQIQISGTKGVCEQLSADDFCFQTDAKGNCIKESAVMVLFSPGSDKKYGSCLANNGAVPDIRQYGMCTNPSYLTLAVQKIAPANMYLNNTLPNFGCNHQLYEGCILQLPVLRRLWIIKLHKGNIGNKHKQNCMLQWRRL